MNRRRWCLLAAGSVLLGGCARVARVDRAVALEDALRAYSGALRWRHLNTANSFLRSPEGRPLASAQAFRDDVRVADYRVVSRAPGPEGDTVTVHAAYEYYVVSRNVVRRGEDVQRWWYDAEARRWYLDGSLPPDLVAAGR